MVKVRAKKAAPAKGKPPGPTSSTPATTTVSTHPKSLNGRPAQALSRAVPSSSAPTAAGESTRSHGSSRTDAAATAATNTPSAAATVVPIANSVAPASSAPTIATRRHTTPVALPHTAASASAVSSVAAPDRGLSVPDLPLNTVSAPPAPPTTTYQVRGTGGAGAGDAASRRIIITRPRKASGSGADVSTSGATSASTAADHTQPMTQQISSAVIKADAAVGAGAPSTPRERARSGFTVAGDVSAAHASLERSARRPSQGRDTAVENVQTTEDADNQNRLAATAGAPRLSSPAVTAASLSHGGHDHTPAGSGARAAQYQHHSNNCQPPPPLQPEYTSRSPSAPSSTSLAQASGNRSLVLHSGGQRAGRLSSSSSSSSSSPSEYNSSFSEEEEDDGCDDSEGEAPVAALPARLSQSSSPRSATVVSPRPAAPQPRHNGTVTSSTSSLSQPRVNWSANGLQTSAGADKDSRPRQVPTLKPPSGTTPRQGLLPHLPGHITSGSTAALLTQPGSPLSSSPRPHGVRAVPERDASDDDDDDDDDDDIDHEFDEEDEEQAVLSYMGGGARELRESLQRASAASAGQPLSSRGSQLVSASSASPMLVSGRQLDGDLTVLSTTSSPILRPVTQGCDGAAYVSPPDVRLSRDYTRRMPLPHPHGYPVSPPQQPLTGTARVLSSRATSDALPSSQVSPPLAPSSHGSPRASRSVLSNSGVSRGSSSTSRRTPVTAPRKATPPSSGRTTPAAGSPRAAPSSASSTTAACRVLSLYDAFHLDEQKTQWLVDDLVLAKVLEYVRLMGYEHPLARGTAKPGAAREPSTPNTAYTAPATAAPAVSPRRAASPPSLSSSSSAAVPVPQLWSPTAAVPSPLIFASTPQDRVRCNDGVPRRATMRTPTTTTTDALDAAHKIKSLLFLDQVEPLRWISEQEYVIGAVLLCCAHTGTPAADGSLVPAIPPLVHPVAHVVHLVQTQFAQWGSFQAFEQLWETQVRLVLGTASPTHQRVFTSPEEGITLYSDFEGGNLWKVEKAVEPYYYYLWLEPDHGSDKRIWFRFAVAGAVEGRTLRFRLLNAATHSKLYRQHGMAPVWRDGAAQPNWTAVDQCSFRVAAGGQSTSHRAHHHHHGHHKGGEGPTSTSGGDDGGAAAGTPGTAPPQWTELSAEDNGEVYFTIVPRSSAAVIQVAFCVPYTYADLLCHLCHWHALVRSSVCSIRFEERVLCRTPDGRKLHLLIITSPNDATKKTGKYDGADGAAISRRRQLVSPPPGESAAAHGYGGEPSTGAGGADGGSTGKDSKGRANTAAQGIRGPYSNFSTGKKLVLISARVHPGEVTASHGCHGLISFLLSSDPRAVRLREHYLFFIVPMLNPDGVSRGHSRLDQFGNNLNRCYHTPDPHTQPTVFALRNVFQHLELSFQERFILYIDFHSHASQSSGFMFGNHLPKSVQHWNMVFPKLVELHARDVFSFALCRFGKLQMSSKDGASRVLFGSTLIHSYTVELTYFTDGRLYADSYLAMNNRGSVILDASASGPEYFQSASAASPPPPPLAAPTTAFPETPVAGLNEEATTHSVPTPTSTRRSRTPAGVATTTTTTTGTAAAQGSRSTPNKNSTTVPASSPASMVHRKRSVGASKPRSRSTAASVTSTASRRRARSEGPSSPRRARRNLVAELIPGSRPGKDVPVPTGPAQAAEAVSGTPGTSASTKPSTPRYLHGIAMPTILCQSALIGQACLLALLDYGVVGGPRALSGELISYGGMDHVLAEVKRAMMRKTSKKKRGGNTPTLP